MKISLAFISIILAMTTIGFCGGQQQLYQLPHTFPIERLAAYENCSISHINATWIVAAHSERLDDQNTRSEILAYRFENNKWKQMFSKAFDDAYNARIELRNDMRIQDNPIIVLWIQYGAAYEALEIYAIEAGSIHHVQTLEAGGFEWAHRTKDSRASLIAYPANPGEKIFYIWNGVRFQTQSQTHGSAETF
jgi:hypothetical protein